MLKNKVALVTGGGSGIGRAVAQVWAREGAKVVVSDLDVAGGEETVKLVRAQGGDAIFVATDVGKAADCEALVNATVAHYGRLDVACNNAGIGGPSAPTADYPLDGCRGICQQPGLLRSQTRCAGFDASRRAGIQRPGGSRQLRGTGLYSHPHDQRTGG